MKAFGCIIISALAIYALVPALGYEVQPLYGRTNFFDLFSPQSLITRFVGLSSRFAILQSTFDLFRSQLTALQTLVTSLQTQIAALQNSIPRCPAAASGGNIISGLCYTVTTIAAGVTFTTAITNCGNNGGSLAEPPTTVAGSKAFYTALKAKFPPQFTTIEATTDRTLWIGYIQNTPGAANPLIAPLSGNTAALTPQAAIFGGPAITTSTNPLAAALKGPLGDIWAAIDFTTLAATAPKAYVCQYNPI